MEDKSYEECAAELSECAEYFIATELDMPRCLKAERLLECSSAPGEAIAEPSEAVKRALSMAGSEKLVCVCGSLYLAGEIRKIFAK